MNDVHTLQATSEIETLSNMKRVLERQRKAFIDEGPVTADKRLDRLERLLSLVFDNQKMLVDAIGADFGNRSPRASLMTDVYAAVETIKHQKKHLRSWMKPSKRPVQFPLGLVGAKARVEYQPKGVVGNIGTWNFPVYIALGPLAGILGAGNRAMLKLSEVTPNTAAAVIELVGKYFDETEVYALTGGPDVGLAFAGLPLDHLIFTGSTGIGKAILAAAAPNLTPVTLELGGKSPVIVGRSADLDDAAFRICVGKGMNAGQVCLSPDYVFVPEESLPRFVERCEAVFSAQFPTVGSNADLTSVINRRHFDRLRGYLEDARARGAQLKVVDPANEGPSPDTSAHRMPMTLVIDPPDDARVMQEEIFGPVLCVKPYRRLEDCFAFINARPRPLALYFFGKDAAEERMVLDNTLSGGVTVNDVMQHVGCEDLPFGGIGPSGMGAYHGVEGFRTFSHARAVFRGTKVNMMKLSGTIPPFGPKTDGTLKQMIRR